MAVGNPDAAMAEKDRHDPMTLTMNDPSLLINLNRYVGVALAVVGSVVVAPRGTVLLWRSLTDWPPPRKQHLRSQLARFLPFLRKDVTVQAPSAMGGVSVFGSATATVSARVWQPNASVDERIEVLHRYITDLKVIFSLLPCAAAWLGPPA